MKTKEVEKSLNRVLKRHNTYYFGLVNLYQNLIEQHVTDDDNDVTEAKIRDMIFKKCNAKWQEYCRKNKNAKPKPDSYYFYNNHKLGK